MVAADRGASSNSFERSLDAGGSKKHKIFNVLTWPSICFQFFQPPFSLVFGLIFISLLSLVMTPQCNIYYICIASPGVTVLGD